MIRKHYALSDEILEYMKNYLSHHDLRFTFSTESDYNYYTLYIIRYRS